MRHIITDAIALPVESREQRLSDQYPQEANRNKPSQVADEFGNNEHLFGKQQGGDAKRRHLAVGF